MTVAEPVPRRPHRPLIPAARPRGLLSRAECRVLALTAAGLNRDETALVLGVSPETVKSRRASLMRKLGARNTPHAVALAFARDYLSAETLEYATAITRQSHT